MCLSDGCQPCEGQPCLCSSFHHWLDKPPSQAGLQLVTKVPNQGVLSACQRLIMGALKYQTTAEEYGGYLSGGKLHTIVVHIHYCLLRMIVRQGRCGISLRCEVRRDLTGHDQIHRHTRVERLCRSSDPLKCSLSADRSRNIP